MKEENQHMITDELLFRYFSEDMSLEEKQAVDDWVLLSVDNKNKLEESKIFYLDLKALQSLKINVSNDNTDQAWKQIKFKRSKLGEDQKNVQPIPFMTLKYAASILLFILGSWFVYNSFIKEDLILTQVDATDHSVEKSLSDGTNIVLNKNASIVYPESFDHNERKVSLNGEAYFEVASNENKPFLILTQNTTIKVVGTSFNVDSRSEVDSIVVTVDEGKVLFSVGKKEELLLAGATGVYIKSTQSLYQKSINNVVTHNFWRTKRLIFNSTNLSDAIHSLNQVYNKSTRLEGNNFAACKITVEFVDEDLSNIIDIISSTLNLQVSQENGQYVLKGNGCN